MTFPSDSGQAVPQPPAQPYGVQPYGTPPHGALPYAGQPYAGQPYAGQPYAGQPYGWPPAAYPAMGGYPVAPRNGAGAASLTLGVIALATFWIPILYLIGSVPCAIIAIVQGSKGRRLAASGWATNPGQARAGMVCGTIALILCGVSLAVGVWMVGSLNY